MKMTPSSVALMAQKNYLDYRAKIDEKDTKDKRHLLYLQKEADYWLDMYLTLSSTDESIWIELGLQNVID